VTSAAEIQQQMAVFLRRPRDLAKDDEARRFADAHLSGNERLSPVEQLEIYREQFFLRHTESLVEDFPGVGGILGQAAWDALVWDYLATVPPTSYDLAELGAGLPDFIRNRERLERRELLVDMATLEWNHVVVFSAPDRPRLEPAKLANVPESAWESARLEPDPGLRLQRVRYPVVALRRELVAARETETEEPVALPDPEPSCLAVHRRERLIHHDVLDPPAYELLRAIADGEPLGRACETAAARASVTLEALGQGLERWFGDWAARGYVVDVVLDTQ
jgi:hypothetical protein